MADRIELFSVTVPAGTLESAPSTFPLSFRDGRVERLEIRIPPGPSGLVGFRVGHSGQSVIPYAGSEWVIGDDERLDWDLDNYPTGDAWELYAYNEDVYSHTLYFRFHVSQVGSAPQAVETPIPIEPIGEAEEPEENPEEFIEVPIGEVPTPTPRLPE